ncbi:hypothetical protein EIL50_05200 [bacterium NHP-B]|nr:hypothetical protein EIL50_05200 [bacterium NHP-B]
MKFSVKTLVCLCTVALGAVQAKAVKFHGVEVPDDSLTAKHVVPKISKPLDKLVEEVLPQTEAVAKEIESLHGVGGNEKLTKERLNLIQETPEEQKTSELYVNQSLAWIAQEAKASFWSKQVRLVREFQMESLASLPDFIANLGLSLEKNPDAFTLPANNDLKDIEEFIPHDKRIFPVKAPSGHKDAYLLDHLREHACESTRGSGFVDITEALLFSENSVVMSPYDRTLYARLKNRRLETSEFITQKITLPMMDALRAMKAEIATAKEKAAS